MVQAKTKARRNSITRALARLRSPRIFIPWLSQNLRHLRPDAFMEAIAAMREVRMSRQRLRRPERQGPRVEILEPRLLLSSVSWIAPTGGDWGVGANWSTGTVPGSGDTAIIASLNPGAQVTYNTGNSTVAAVQASSPLEITGGTLTVTGSTQITGTTLILDGGTLADTTLSTASGGLIQTLAGSTTTLDAGTLGGNTTLTVASGSTLDVADNLTLGSGATLNVDAGGTLNFVDGTSNSQTISGSGAITLDAASGSYAAGQINANGVNSGSQVTFDNGVNITGLGTSTAPNSITSANGNTIVFDGIVTDASISSASGGALQANSATFQGTTLAGSLSIASGTVTLEDYYNYSIGGPDVAGVNAGTVSIASGATLYMSNEYYNLTSSWTNASGTIDIASGGILKLGGDFTQSDLGVISNVGGTIDFSGTLTNTGQTLSETLLNSWSMGGGAVIEGTVGISGQVITLAVSAPQYSGESNLTLEGVTVDGTVNINSGTVSLEDYYNYYSGGSDVVGVNDGTINIASGATLNLRNDYYNLTSSWTNATGTINIAGGGTLNLGGDFTQSDLGTINNSGGTIDFSGALTNTGGNLSAALLNGWTMDWGAVIGGNVGATGDTIIISGSSGLYLEGATLQGAVTINGGYVYLEDYYNYFTGGSDVQGVNDGTFNVASGAALYLSNHYYNSTSSSWTNASGTINIASGGTLHLGGYFTQGDLGTINNSGGTIDFSGTLTNTGQTVSVVLLNSWTMDYGTIIGGTVGASGQTVNVANNYLYLNGATLAANLSVASGATLWIDGGLTMQAGATVTIASGGSLWFDGGGTTGQAISGSGQIDLGSGSTVHIYYGAITLGAGITFAGAGNIVNQYDGLLINQGTIDANVAGPALTIAAPFQNDGTLTTANGGNLAITGASFTLDSDGTLTVNTGSAVTLGSGTSPWINSGTINISGGTLDIGGLVTTADLGVANWNYTAGQVELTGTIDNTGEPLTLNGVTSLIPGGLELTNGQQWEAGSAFDNTPINIASNFTSNFSFQLTNANADGFTFTIQGQGPQSLGRGEGDLGYGGIENSIAVKFDLYQNANTGDPSNNSTGLFLNGNQPFGGTSLNSADINLHSGDVINVQVSYTASSNSLVVTETDTVTNTSLTQTYSVNIANYVGPVGWAGFTAGSGFLTATQQILSWSINGSAVNLANTANTSTDVLNLSPTTTGSLLLNGGTIQGGAISATGGVGLEVVPTAPAPIPLADSGFETPVLASGAYQREPSGTGWNFPYYYSGISANGSGYTSGNSNAPQGNQVAFIDYSTQISQSINFATAGTYSLNLLAAQRGGANLNAQTLQVQIDGQAVYTFVPQGTNYQQYTTPAFNVSAGAHTITIVGLDNAGGDNTAFIDSVAINPAIATLDGVALDSNLTIESGATLNIADGLTMGSGAAVTVDAGAVLNFIDGTSNIQTVSGSGAIVLDAATGSYAAGQINANGVNAGSLVTFGGGVSISGLGAAGSPNNIHAASGNTAIFAGDLANVAISASSGGYLIAAQPWQSTYAFDAVTVASNLTIQAGDELDISDGMTLVNNATIFANGAYRTIHFVNGTSNTQTLSGTGNIQFYTSGTVYASGMGVWNASSVVSVGSGITISGAGYIAGNVGATLINYGTIEAPNINGHGLAFGETTFENYGTIAVELNSTLDVGVTNIVNEIGGTISVAAGGELDLNTNFAPWAGSWSNSGTITVDSGGLLDLGGNFTTAGIGTINSSGTIDVSGKLNNASSTLSAGTLGSWIMAGGTIAGGTIGSSGTTVNLAGSSVTFDATTLDSNVTVSAGTTLSIADGLTLGSGATITVDAGGTLNFVDGTSNAQTVSGSGTITLAAASGSLAAGQLNANGANSGTSVTVGAGVSITGTGIVNVASGNTLALEDIVNGATITAASGSDVQLYNMTLENGAMTIDSGATLTLENNDQYLINATLTNYGIVNDVSGWWVYFEDGSTVNNAVGGVFTITSDDWFQPGLYNDPSSMAFNNAGTLNIDIPETYFAAEFLPSGSANVYFDNTGTVNVNQAILQLGQPGGNIGQPGNSWSNTGTITVASGGTLNLAGNFTTTDIGTINSSGTIDFSGKLTNTSNTLSATTLNTWTMDGGDIIGGTVGTSGQTVNLTGYSVTLDGVALDSNLTVASGTTLNIADGLTLGSGVTITVDAGAVLNFVDGTTNTQTIGGSGSIVLQGASGSYAPAQVAVDGAAAGSSVTFNNGVSIQGRSEIAVLDVAAHNTLIFDDTISQLTLSVASGGYLQTGGQSTIGTLDTVTLASSPTLLGPSDVDVTNSLGLLNGAMLTVDAGSTVNFVDGSSNSQSVYGIGSITLGAASGSYAAGQINVDGTVAGSSVTFNNGNNITGPGGVTVASGNTVIFDDSVTNALIFAASGGNLQTNGTSSTPAIFDSVTLGTNSNLNVASGATLDIADGLTLGSGASITVDAGANLNFIDGTSNIQTVSGNGTIMLDAAIGSYAAAQLIANGTSLESSVTFANGVNITGGNIAVSTGNTLSLDNYVASAGISVAGGATLDLPGGWSVASDTITIYSGGTMNLGGVVYGDQDIGTPGIARAAVYSPGSGNWSVSGTGSGIGGTSDQFNYQSQSWTGDGTIIANISSMSSINTGAQAGVMFSGSADPGAMFAGVFITGGGDAEFQWRTADGSTAQTVQIGSISAPRWIKLVRAGNSFSAYYSSNGLSWTQISSSQTVSMGSTAVAGMAAASGDNTTSNSAIFNNVELYSATEIWNAATISTATVIASGTLVYVENGLTFTNNAALTLDAGAQLDFIDPTGTFSSQTVGDSGSSGSSGSSIILDAASGGYAAGQINIDGTTNNSQVTFQVNITGQVPAGTIPGAITVATGNTLVLDDTTDGVTMNASGGVVDVAGGTTTTIDNNAGITSSGTGQIQLTGGQLSIDSSQTVGALNITGGKLTLDAKLSVNSLNFNSGVIESGGTGSLLSLTGTDNWNGGTLDVATTVTAGATLNITASTGYLYLGGLGGGVTLSTSGGSTGGVINLTSPTYNVLMYSGDEINNAGTFDITGGAGFQLQNTGSATFNNSGQLEKTAGTGTATFNSGVLLDNVVDSTQAGTVTVDTGTLQIAGGGYNANTGTGSDAAFTADGGYLQFSGGTFTLHADTTMNSVSSSNLQQIEFDGATITVDAGDTLSVKNLNFSSGALNGPGSVSLTGTSNTWSGGTDYAALTVNAGAVLDTAGNVTAGGALNNSGGTVEATTGTLQIADGGVDSGTFGAAGGVIDFSGGISTLDAGTALQASGTSAIELTGGTLTFNAAIIANNLTMTGGTLTGNASGALTLTDIGNWSGGTISVPVIVDAGTTLNIAGNDTLSSTTLTNDGGAINLSGTLNNSGSTLLDTSTAGSWNVNNETVTGGTIDGSNGPVALSGSSQTSLTLSNVTLAGTVNIDGGMNVYFPGSNGLYLQTGAVLNQGVSSLYLFTSSGGAAPLAVLPGSSGGFTLTNTTSGLLSAASYSGGTATLTGGLLISGDGIIASDLGNIDSAATIDLNGLVVVEATSNQSSPLFNNIGTIEGTGQFDVANNGVGTAVNSGTIIGNVSGQMLEVLASTMSSTGSLAASGGGYLNADIRTLTLLSGGSVTIGSASALALGQAGGTVTNAGAIANDGGLLNLVDNGNLATLDISNWTNNGYGTTTVSGTLNDSGLGFSVAAGTTGPVTIAPSAALNIGGNLAIGNSETLTIEAGGMLSFDSSPGISQDVSGAGSLILNAGDVYAIAGQVNATGAVGSTVTFSNGVSVSGAGYISANPGNTIIFDNTISGVKLGSTGGYLQVGGTSSSPTVFSGVTLDSNLTLNTNSVLDVENGLAEAAGVAIAQQTASQMDLLSGAGLTNSAIQPLASSSGTVTAQILGFTGANSQLAGGVAFVDSTNSGAAMALVMVSNSGDLTFQWIASDGATEQSAPVVTGVTLPVQVRLVRWGDTVSAYYSYSTGDSGWAQIGTSENVMFSNATILAGLTMSDPAGASTDGVVIGAQSLSVTIPASLPQISGSLTPPALENQPYMLNLSTNNFSAMTGWKINWGDGTTADTLSGSVTSDTHFYPDGTANYTITITAQTASGSIAAAPIVAQVVDAVPQPVISGTSTVSEGQAYTLALSPTTADGDSVTSWSINWGDGTPIQNITGSPASINHTFAAGVPEPTITAFATDDDGTGSATQAVAVIPAGATNLAVTGVTATSATLTWTNNSYVAEAMIIEDSTDGGATYAAVLYASGNASSATVTNLLPNQTYTFQIIAANGSAESAAAPSDTASATTLVASPANFTTIAVSATEIGLSWTASAGATGYTVEQSTDDITWTSLTPTALAATATGYNDTSVTGTGPYYYQVIANGPSNNNSTASAAGPIYTLDGSALNPHATFVSGSEIDLAWTDPSNSTYGFNIQDSTNGGTSWSNVTSTPLTPGFTSFAWNPTSPFTPGTTYDLRVQILNGGGGYTNSGTVGVTIPAIPASVTGLTATAVSSTQINLSWNDTTSDETGFVVQQQSFNGTWVPLAALSASTTSYDDTGLSAGESYGYQVAAVNSSGNSGFTAVSASTPANAAPAAPTSVDATQSSPTEIDLNWVAGSGGNPATSFVIQREDVTSSGSWQTIQTVSAGAYSYQDTAVAAGDVYQYQVAAANTAGSSAYVAATFSDGTTSSAGYVNPSMQPPLAPTGLAVIGATVQGIGLVWSDPSVYNASLILNYETPTGTYNSVSSLQSGQASFEFTPQTIGSGSYLQPGTYRFQLQGTNSSGKSADSSWISATVTAPAPTAPNLAFSPNNDQQYKINLLSDASVPLPNDGSEANAQISIASYSQPQHGKLAKGSSSGTYTYTASSGFYGTDSFTYTVQYTPQGGAAVTSEQGTVTLQVANQIPEAESNVQNFPQSGGTISGTLGAYDQNGNPLTYRLLAQPAFGSVTVDPTTGAYTYSFTPLASGGSLPNASFTFDVTDHLAGTSASNVLETSNIASVNFVGGQQKNGDGDGDPTDSNDIDGSEGTTFTPNEFPVAPPAVAPSAPLAPTFPDTFSVQQGTTLTVAASNSPLTQPPAYEINVPAGQTAPTISFGQIIDQTPKHGTFTPNSDGSFTYTPTDKNFVGTDYVTYTLKDPNGTQSNYATIFFNVTKPTVDLLMDTNNNGQITAADESGKASGTGKVIIADTLDVNGNNIPGYADGISTIAAGAGDSLPEGTFAPLQLSALGIADPSSAYVEFNYSAADPASVTQTSPSSGSIDTYSPGSGGYLRIWNADSTTPRNSASILSGGNFIPDNTAIPLSDILKGSSSLTDLYVEGVNPSDPNPVTITVKIDPTGDFASGDNTISDKVNVTVASLQLVYTDVTGISHANPTKAFTTNMDQNRIAPNLQPGGIAADWQNGVDDGSLLLVRAVGSQALENLIHQGNLTLDFGQLFPHIGTGIYSLQSDGSNGELLPLSTWQSNLTADTALKGVQTNTNPAQGSTRWEGTAAGGAALDVLGTQFYEPPAEFLPQGESSNAFFRQIHVGVSLNYSNTTLPPLYAGAKPGALMLTRPPVVFVHGINSDPYSAWQGPGGMAQTLQGQKYIITPFSFADHSGAANDYGSGPLTSDWQSVQNAVEATIEDFRYGLVNNSIYNPDIPSGNPTLVPTGLAEGTLIAVQKVDVVAHSYGGLLTRWYMEQATNSSGGKLFEDFRNIRSLVEIGTPNLGSPLANMIDAIYSNPTIGNAQINSGLLGTLGGHTEKNVLTWMQSQGYLATSPNGANPYPFFEDAAINSPLLAQLNALAAVFSNGVSYAAVYGTHTELQKFEGPVPFTELPIFGDIQPLGPNGGSYFPWIQQLDGANNDSIVPTYSAMLPDTAYDYGVNMDHINLESDPQVEAQVLAWLDNPNLPLGSTQRQDIQPSNGTQNQAFVVSNSDQNAYNGGKIGSNGEVTGAGLNPSAIVGVQLDGIDYNTATWNLSVTTGPNAGAGVKKPILTGMATKSQLVNGLTISLVSPENEHGGYVGPLDTLDSVAVTYGEAGVLVNPTAWAAAGPGDYVPFEISALEMGRSVAPGITGPSLNGVQADSATQAAMVEYSLGGILSPDTQVNLPTYTPTAPVVISDNPTGQIQLQLNGAFQVTDATSGSSPTSYSVKIYDSNSHLLWEDDVSAAAEPLGVWNGLALTYSLAAILNHDSNGNIIGVDGSYAGPLNIFQNFWQAGVTSDSGYNSGTVEVQ